MSTYPSKISGMSPCPCCGRLVFEGPPGTEEICPVCFWQDDWLGLRDPLNALGPNTVSLIEAQANFASIGLSDPRYKNVKDRLKKPDCFELDGGWRPINLEKDSFAFNEDALLSKEIYYWRAME